MAIEDGYAIANQVKKINGLVIVVTIFLILAISIQKVRAEGGVMEEWDIKPKSVNLTVGEGTIRITLVRREAGNITKLNITLMLPEGLNPSRNALDNNKRVIAKLNGSDLYSNNTYNEEMRKICWNLFSPLNLSAKYFILELNVNVSETLQGKSKLNLTIEADGFKKSFPIDIGILKVDFELLTYEYKDGKITFTIRNCGNACAKIQNFSFSFLTPKYFTITDTDSITKRQYNETHVYYIYSRSGEFILGPGDNQSTSLFSIIVNDTTELKKWENISVTTRISGNWSKEKTSSCTLKFKTEIVVNELNRSTHNDGITQKFEIKVRVNGNITTLRLADKGHIRIQLLPDTLEVKKVNCSINNITWHLVDNAIHISNYNITVPSEIRLIIEVNLKPSYDENPSITVNASLGQNIRDGFSTRAYKINVFKNVKVERLFGFLPYLYNVVVNDTRKGNLTLHVGSNVYNLTLTDGKAPLVLLREAFLPLFKDILIHAEDDKICFSDGTCYYLKIIPENPKVFTGTGVIVITALTIPIGAFLLARRSRYMSPPPPPPMEEYEEEYDLG